MAQIFNEQALQSKDAGHSAAVEYKMQLADRTRFQSESLELFDDDSLNSMERPVRVEMIFLNLPLNRSLSLEHGPDNLNNWTSVTSYEDAWFNDLTTKFADAMGKVPSQKGSWFRKQKGLSQLLLSLLIIVIAYLVDLWVSRLSHPTSPPPQSIAPFVTFVRAIPPWLSYGALGLSWGFLLYQFIESAWPDVEFAFGLPHLREAENRRKRVKVVMAAAGALIVNLIAGLILR